MFDWIKDLVVDGFAWVATKLIILKFEAMFWSLQISYDIAKEVVDSLNITQKLQAAFVGLDSKTLAILYKVKLFDFINLIMNGYITSIIFRFLPF